MRIKGADLSQNGPPPARVSMKCRDEDPNSNAEGEPAHDDAPDCDYMWFQDYNSLFQNASLHPTSVLSSLTASYKGLSDLRPDRPRLALPSRYDVFARDLDANLAEADMESFRTQDIHLLMNDRIIEDESTGSLNTMSICKSELLFSPVKEAHAHGVHFSVDSLDCELPSERELILTCRANKDNYTIAFEGSVMNYDDENADYSLDCTTDNKTELDERTRRNLELLERCQKLTSTLASMARSEQGLTTWSKLRHRGPLRRHGSGNNNDENPESTGAESSVIKSHSLPNLVGGRKLASSLHSDAMSNSTIDSFTHATNQRLSGGDACMKVYDISNAISRSNNSTEPMSTSSTENQSDKSQAKPFNLVKLFMKQKSISNEGISMEQLGSECWPSSSGGESDSFDSKKQRKMEKLPKMSTSDGSGQDETDYVMPQYDVMNTTQTLACDTALIEEEENENRVDGLDNKVCDSESNLYATVNKPVRRNVNNNNSPMRARSANKKSFSSSSATSFTISSCSDSDGTQLTKLHRLLHKDLDNRATSTQVQVETIDRSMQTSSIAASYIRPEKDYVKVIEPSFLKKLKEGDCQKPVFVLYPSYALPDISFLNGRPNIYLNPQKISIAGTSKRSTGEPKGKRPFSCNDVELLRKKGFDHIKDWESLNFLLPTECKQLLAEFPEVMYKMNKENTQTRGKLTSTPKPKCRPMSCDCNNYIGNQATNVSSSSSTATQPSSGYRGSSTMLTDSAQNSPAPANSNPLFVYRYDTTSSETSFDKSNPKRSSDSKKGIDIAPPRPPLPKGILRKSMDKVKKSGSSKRYSMFEMEEHNQDPVICMNVETEHKLTKRRSLQEPYYLQRQNSFEKRKNNDLAAKKLSHEFLDAADKDAEYQEFYHDEGVGTESSFDSGNTHEKYRPHSPPLPKPRNKMLEYIEFPPPSALISSAELQELEEFLEKSGFSCGNMEQWDHNQVLKCKNLVEMPIREEGEITPSDGGSPKRNPLRTSYDLSHKRDLVSSVTDAVEAIIQHFSSASNQSELTFLGDSSQSPACARVALSALCPALYAILNDGLKENIETSFGAVSNSVWQMVESTARQGPITKSLHELVMRINSEDAINEGLVKFNAFILGLLNAQSVDVWVSYIRTRESDLRKHYSRDSLLRLGCSGDPACRGLLDALLACLEPLRLLPFRLDVMFEMRELHRSLKRLECEVRAVSRLVDGAEATPPADGATNGGKFRKLQLKWELLTGESVAETPGTSDSPGGRCSRIPRPVTSPVRPAAPAASPVKPTSHRGIPVAVKKLSSPTTPASRPVSTPIKRQSLPTRASRVEQGVVAPPRPASLPHGRPQAPHPRRRASSSLGRADRSPTAPPAQHNKTKPKMVRTLWHRLPSDSGHLAFNEGERLRLVLEVDEHWLLCCRGDKKGLVPREAVILDTDRL